jgi:hypothetical protein
MSNKLLLMYHYPIIVSYSIVTLYNDKLCISQAADRLIVAIKRLFNYLSLSNHGDGILVKGQSAKYEVLARLNKLQDLKTACSG